MKKLLSLIGVVSIVGSGASAVVACGDDSADAASKLTGPALTPAKILPDQKTANEIAAKVKNKNLILPAVTTNLDTSNKNTQQALKNVLYEDNKGAKGLTQQEVNQYFSFSKTTLDVAKAVAVTATITVKEAKATVNLMVSIPNGATALAKEMVNRNLVIPYKSGTARWSIDSNEFLALLRANLLEQNPGLKKYSSSDFTLKNIQVKGKPAQTTILSGEESDLQVTVVSNNDNTSTPVDMFVYPYGTAAAIADKIQDANVTVSLDSQTAADYNTDNPAFRKAILDQLESNNNLTITAEKATLSVPEGQSIPPANRPKTIQMTINVPTTSGTMDAVEKDISVTSQYPDVATQTIATINYAIGTTGTIVLPTGIPNLDLTNQDVRTAIFNAIKSATANAIPLPSGAVSDEMSYALVGGGTTLMGDTSNAVAVTYTSDAAGDVQTATTTLNVYPPLDRAHQVIAMFKYLSNAAWRNDLDGYFGGLLANWNNNKDLVNNNVIASLLANAAVFINPFVSDNMKLDAAAFNQLSISAAPGSRTALAETQNVASDTDAASIVVKYGDASNAPETTIKALMMTPAATFYVSYAAVVSYVYTTSGNETWSLPANTNPDITSPNFKDQFLKVVQETAASTGYPYDYGAYKSFTVLSFASEEGLPNNTLTPGQTSELYLTVTNKGGGAIGFNQFSIDQFKWANVKIETS